MGDIVCLCGSTRFKDKFVEVNRLETMAGNIVLAPGVFAHSGDPLTPEEKIGLDELHLKKIDLADRIAVVMEEWYVGESTMKEIDHAIARDKKVEYYDCHPMEGGACHKCRKCPEMDDCCFCRLVCDRTLRVWGRRHV